MAITWTFPTIIVAESVRETCKQLCTYFAGESAAEMFDVPVYKDGELYGRISAGAVDENFIITMTDPARLAQDSGMTLEEAAAILSQTIVSHDSPAAVLADNGLTMTQPEATE